MPQVYRDDFSLLYNFKGSVLPRAFLYSLPSGILAFLILIFEDHVTKNVLEELHLTGLTQQSVMWNAITVVISLCLGFRTRQALGRFWEGTSLLHQMRGEWFDAASCLVSFSRDGKVHKGKGEEVIEFRHTLIRLFSLMHGTALDEISGNIEDRYEVLDVYGLDHGTLKFLKHCQENNFNRVEALQHMIQVLVTHNFHAGVLTIAPPILSRVYQTLSRGLVNLLNAKKIKDTAFPFPWAQIILVLLVMHAGFTPLIMVQVLHSNKFLAVSLSFVPIFSMFSLNLVAIELEMPFGSDANDLALRDFQEEMNHSLLMLVHQYSDHLPHTSPTCVKSYDGLKNYWRATRIRNQGLKMSDSKTFIDNDELDLEDLDNEDDDGKPRRSSAAPDPQPKQSTKLSLDTEAPQEDKAHQLPEAKPTLQAPLPELGPSFVSPQPAVTVEKVPSSTPSQGQPEPVDRSAAVIPSAKQDPVGGCAGSQASPVPLLSPELHHILEMWLQKTDAQLTALRHNSEMVDNSAHLISTSLSKHSDNLVTMVQAIMHKMDTPSGGIENNAASGGQTGSSAWKRIL